MYNIGNITNIYVSNEYGDDTMNGGFSPENVKDGTGPVKTIERALKIVSDMRMFGSFQPVSIKIADSEYFIEKPIVIDNTVSGVTIEPYKKASIYAGVRLKDFKKDRFNNVDCISFDVSDLLDKGLWFTDFYVNDKRAKMTRYPKTGFLKPQEVENNSCELNASSKWFIADKKDLSVIKDFKNFGDCIISYNHYWIDEHSPIESYDINTGKIVFKYPSRFTIEPTRPESKLNYVIENVAEAFENEGEWYLDRTDKKLYYIPEKEDKNIEAFLPVCDKLFIFEGEKDNKVNNVTIRNFTLGYTRGEYKSIRKVADSEKVEVRTEDDGYASDIQSVCWAHGSIEFKFAHNCFIEGCTLKCFGVHGISVYEGCDNINILSNDIYMGGAGGIAVSGGLIGSDKEYHTHSMNISNNIIRSCGRRYLSACGILIRHAYQNKISHNTIYDQYYTGISVGWVWGFADSICCENIIEYNHIYNIGQGVLSDMGGIYLLGKQKGTIVRNNLIHNVKSCHYGGWGIYTDEGSSYITVENNICYDFSQNAYHQHYGNLNVVRNNIFAFANEETVKVTRNDINMGIIFNTNILVTENKPVYTVSWERDWAYMHIVSASNNIIYSIGGEEPIIVNNGDGAQYLSDVQKKFNFETDSEIVDPKFRDIKKYDFELEDDSPAYKKGFKKIDMKNIGAVR